MVYQISENEFYRLVSCANQINFIADACAGLKNRSDFSINGLEDFLNAQQETLQAVIKATEERREAQAVLDAEQGTLQWFDWLHALRIARGDARHTPSGAEARIAEKFEKAARIQEGMTRVCEEWAATLAAHAPQAPGR